jgi:Tfp pilus assembly protein PilP
MSTPVPSLYRTVIRVLSVQQRALMEAGASDELLDMYRAVVRYLSQISDDELNRILRPQPARYQEKQTRDTISLSEAEALSLDQIEQLVADDKTSRKTLEAIAIGRFEVPRGSMRSFANIEMLKTKLTTLVQNERTHLTISSIAQHSRS